jgi:hypothetical protein
MSHGWIDGDLPQFVPRPSNAGPLIIDLERMSRYLITDIFQAAGGLEKEQSLSRILELRQPTGSDNRLGDLHQVDWLASPKPVGGNGKSFDAARSNDAAAEKMLSPLSPTGSR